MQLPVAGIGTMQARPATSDVDCIRYVFGYNPFDLSDMPMVESKTQARYEAILAQGKVPVIVDCGANIGATARWFAYRYPQARIAAVEPESENLAMLARNCGDNPAIAIIDAAIGCAPGHVALSDDSSWAIQSHRADSGPRIVTVDQAVAAAGGGELFIVKINIEGFEDDLFAANLGWLDGVEVVMLEPHDWIAPGRGISRNFQRAMGPRDFDIFIKADFLVYARRPASDKAADNVKATESKA